MRQAHPRHDWRDAVVQGIGIAIVSMFVGLFAVPALLVEAVNAFGVYQATLAVGVLVGAVGLAALRWIAR